MKRILSLILLLLGGLGISQAAFYTRIPYQNVAGKMQVKVSVGGVEGRNPRPALRRQSNNPP